MRDWVSKEMRQKLFRIFGAMALAVTGVFGLTGCFADIARPIEAALEADSRFDGVWTGWVRFSIGEDECPRRASLRAEIKGGGLDAQVRWTNRPSLFNGYIRDGELRRASFDRAGSSFAEVEGTFSEREASGVWRSQVCRGTWKMQKIRNS